MPRPQFAEMLVERRRQLGLSISQASQVLRLKEQVLIAFEEGDFERIPKSGYAQGMLSSYARYLGLNSREVVRQFSEDLDEYLASNPGIDQEAAAYGGGTGDVTRRQVSTFGTTPYVASRGLLPTSGGPAGDMGAFATTSQPHSRASASSYASQSYEPASYMEDHRYTSRPPATNRGNMQSRSMSRYSDAHYADAGAMPSSYGYGRDQVTTRSVSPSQYTDDLRYDDSANPYEAASTSSGRRSSRNIASTERPNVSRQRNRQRGRQGQRPRNAQRPGSSRNQRGRGGNGRSGGIVGAVGDFFSDGRRAVIAIGALLTIALTVIIIFSVNSCVANRSGSSDTRTVSVTQTTSTTAETNTTTSAASDATATSSSQDSLSAQSTTDTSSSSSASSGTSTATTSRKKNEAEETKVVVSVDSGAVSWVDIQCDGESMVADTITGPWSETYEVHDSIIIEVGDTTAVTVTENGLRRQFDSKTSGIGNITIQGTPEKKAETEEDGDKTTSTGSSSSSKKTDDEEETTSKSDSEKKTTSDSDSKSTKSEFTGNGEYYDTYNGYDIYYDASSGLFYFTDENGVVRNAADGTAL